MGHSQMPDAALRTAGAVSRLAARQFSSTWPFAVRFREPLKYRVIAGAASSDDMPAMVSFSIFAEPGLIPSVVLFGGGITFNCAGRDTVRKNCLDCKQTQSASHLHLTISFLTPGNSSGCSRGFSSAEINVLCLAAQSLAGAALIWAGSAPSSR